MDPNYQSSTDSIATLNIVHEHETLTGLGLGSQSLPYPGYHNFQPVPRFNPRSLVCVCSHALSLIGECFLSLVVRRSFFLAQIHKSCYYHGQAAVPLYEMVMRVFHYLPVVKPHT
jgi:hypothetical protein